MTLKVVHRPARITKPVTKSDDEVIASPPQMADAPVGGMPVQTLLPVLGSVSSITMMLVLRSNPAMVVVGAVVLVVALVGGVGMAVSSRGNAVRQRRTQRERYLDFLEKTRASMRERTKTIRDEAILLDPPPEALIDVIMSPERIWERRRRDPDFLRVRVGAGDVRWLGLNVPADENPTQPFDPIMQAEAAAVAEHYTVIPGMPVTVSLEKAAHVAVIGDREQVLAAARAMIVQLAAFHAPEDLQLAAAFPERAAADWAGFDLLPHVSMDGTFDGPVPARRVAATPEALVGVLATELGDRAQAAAEAKRSLGNTAGSDGPRLVVFLDDHGHISPGIPMPDAELSLAELNVTIVHLIADRIHEPSDGTIRVRCDNNQFTVTDAREEEDAEPVRADTDRVPLDLFDAIARMLTPLRLALTRSDDGENGRAIGVTELLGIEDITALSTQNAWKPRSSRDFLRVPIALDDFGATVFLDLKESAQLGMGPHGILIGATGSGKSEFLRTLISALALSHSPEDLSMVLVDYKGGSAFAPFAGLPHVAGIIDNLADDPQLIERVRASITGEIVRRQKVLKDADAKDIATYHELRRQHPEMPALPYLFLVIDEFGELLTAEPDFIELLMMIGRIGRSIGIHLLPSSQRIEAGKLRGLDTYLSYRIALRTFSESESATVLDSPDAFHLPAVPGYGYLKVDTSIFRRFRAGYVSGPIPGTVELPDDDGQAREPLLLPTYNGIAAADGDDGEQELARPQTGRALIDEIVDRLRVAGRATAPIWLPPLPTRLTLGRVIPGTAPAVTPGGVIPLVAPIGLVDEPSQQKQGPWMLDLSVSGGHIGLIGAPGSGRTTFLRTLGASLALSYTPRQVSIYGMDFTGGGLSRIEGFPHVGGIATRSGRERIRRLFEELNTMLAVREATFRERGFDSVQDLRKAHAEGRVPELGSADVVLLLDGLGELRADFDEFEDNLADLLQRGGSFGLHVVLTMTRWGNLPSSLQPLVGTRLELRLNDPTDSQIARKLAETLKADQPGRVLTDQSLFAQIALPVLDDTDDEQIGDALADLARQSAESWGGPAAAPIRLLPEDYSPDELPEVFDEPDRIPFGLRQDAMQPALLDLAGRDQHLIVLGDAESGKTTLLRGIVQGLLDRHDDEELVIALMDIRGALAPDIPEDYLGGHATTSTQARELAAAIAQELDKRQAPGADRSKGPRIVVIVDDYDIIASGGTEPLEPLLPYLPSARDLRFNVLATRPVAGASRAFFDKALISMRDTGGSVLVMSGERSEGPLVPGVYAEQMVPGRGRFVRRGERPWLVQVAHFHTTPAQPKPPELQAVELQAIEVEAGQVGDV